MLSRLIAARDWSAVTGFIVGSALVVLALDYPALRSNRLPIASFPTMFMVKYTSQTGLVCNATTHTLTSGNYPEVSLADGDQDGSWNGRVNDGTSYANMSMPFTKGMAITNGERDNEDDIAFSHFRAIEERWSAGWNFFDDVEEDFDNDPDYVFCKLNDHNHEVAPSC